MLHKLESVICFRGRKVVCFRRWGGRQTKTPHEILKKGHLPKHFSYYIANTFLIRQNYFWASTVLDLSFPFHFYSIEHNSSYICNSLVYDSTRPSKVTCPNLCRSPMYFMPAPLLARPLWEPLQCKRKPPKNSKKKKGNISGFQNI